MRWRRKSRRSGRPKPPQSRSRRPGVRQLLLHLPRLADSAELHLDIVQCEMLAARAAETGGGGSPCWGHTTLGAGEEAAIALEVYRCLVQGTKLMWSPPARYTNLS